MDLNKYQFTGERVVPNKTTHQKTFSEHLLRYALAMNYVKSARVLDVACGTGYGLQMFSYSTNELYGADIDNEALECAGELINANLKKIDFEKQSLNDFYKDNYFDVVVSFETIEHLENPEFFIREIHKVLKTGGAFIYSIPLVCPNKYHKRVYEIDDVLELMNISSGLAQGEALYLQKGFQIIDLSEIDVDSLDKELNKKGNYLIGVCRKK